MGSTPQVHVKINLFLKNPTNPNSRTLLAPKVLFLITLLNIELLSIYLILLLILRINYLDLWRFQVLNEPDKVVR